MVSHKKRGCLGFATENLLRRYLDGSLKERVRQRLKELHFGDDENAHY